MTDQKSSMDKTEISEQKSLWMTGGADLMRAVKTLYFLQKNPNEFPPHCMMFDTSIPVEELYEFLSSNEFKELFFKLDTISKLISDEADIRNNEFHNKRNLEKEAKKVEKQRIASLSKTARLSELQKMNLDTLRSLAAGYKLTMSGKKELVIERIINHEKP
jgi:hypothetical protein